MMWAIIFNQRDRLHSVGFYDPTGKFHVHRDFDTPDDAARYIHWLNGGDSRDAFYDGDALQ